MIQTRTLALLLFISLVFNPTSITGKFLKRRQIDSRDCQAIQGFECKCSHFRVVCTTDRELPSQINIVDNEKGKYTSVELVILAQNDINIDDRTFEPIKDLFKFEVDNLEFRVKFEKFTGLRLSKPRIFNNIFPDRLPLSVRKHIALEIYNPEVPPQDHKNLFENLQVDSLELYALYPFQGTFQELFDGANIKFVRLSGGEIRSDFSKPFSGNIARLELAKQASSLSAQNFPLYPAHEYFINAFYITEFQTEHPPNYDNLGELRVHSPQRIPANAFRQFSNINTLSVSTNEDIDPQALNGLTKLEKLIVKDVLPSIELINSVPQINELEVNVEQLDPTTQCDLLERLVNGKLALQTSNGRQCSCVTALLDHAAGRFHCNAQGCDQSSCPAIRNNYDSAQKTFKELPSVHRRDGSDAFRPRDIKIHPGAYQISYDDRTKIQQAFPQQTISEQDQHSSGSAPSDHQIDTQPAWIDHQENNDQDEDFNQDLWSDDHHKTSQPEDGDEFFSSTANTPNVNEADEGDLPFVSVTPSLHDDDQIDQDKQDNLDIWDDSGKNENEDLNPSPVEDLNQSEDSISTTPSLIDLDKPTEDNGEQEKPDTPDQDKQGEDDSNMSDEKQGQDEDKENGEEKHDHSNTAQPNQDDGKSQTSKGKGFTWWPIIIITASIVGLLILGFIFFIIRQRNNKQNYNPAPTSEPQSNQP